MPGIFAVGVAASALTSLTRLDLLAVLDSAAAGTSTLVVAGDLAAGIYKSSRLMSMGCASLKLAELCPEDPRYRAVRHRPGGQAALAMDSNRLPFY
ncbi:MAG: hypothetical protein Q8O52_05310 [Sulfuritalea sp.]|nr:hypothetical protein [Sulfuritalea sp.]